MPATETYTPKALVALNGWNDETRKSPVLAFLEKCEAYFDSRDHSDLAEWYTEDFSFITPHGDEMSSSEGHGDDHAFAQGAAKYYLDPLEELRHVPQQVVVLDSKTGPGYDAYYQGILYANVHGTPDPSEKKVKDDKGQEHDVMIPVFYHFVVVKDDSKHGLRIRHITGIKDTGRVNDILDKRDHSHKRSTK